ncbi:hypothetical protein EDB86DRAFT_3074696 [Lactarius hatsudake]|nr:hypothetical protein EDB86DRAFT_3074696 [Lactarius hatsudake]
MFVILGFVSAIAARASGSFSGFRPPETPHLTHPPWHRSGPFLALEPSDIRSLFKPVLREYEKLVATKTIAFLLNCDSADDISALTGVPNVSRPTPSPDEDVGLLFPPAKAIFAGIGTFPLYAIKSVGTSYDAFIPPTTAMTEIIVKIFVELLSTLAFATSVSSKGDTLLGENETDAVLQRLDRLKHEEARTSAAQTLEVVYRLMKDTKVVMDA